MGNITQVHFKDGQECCYNITGLEQWDKGQKLEISGLDNVEEYVEVHFSLQQYCGTAKRILGKMVDGILHTYIPAFIMEGPEYICAGAGTYSAYAWVYVSNEESAETIRKMEFVIKARPKPAEYVTPEDLDFLEQLEAEMKNKLDKSGHAPNKVLGTDAEGNVITKDEGTGATGEDQILQFAIKPTTDKASFHNIQDSAEYKVLDIGMEGKTEQKSTSGKNLYNGGDIIGTQNANSLIDYPGVNPIPAGTYTFSANVKSSDTDTNTCLVLMYYEDGTYGPSVVMTRGNRQSKTFTLTNTAVSFTCYAADSNVLSEGDTFSFTDIQIEAGSVATSYEPYTGRQPSPNPEYPQEIINAGELNEETGRYEIECKVVNKNLWDKEYASSINNWERVPDYIQSSGFYDMPIFVGKGNKFTLSYKDTLPAGLGIYAGIAMGHNKPVNYWFYNSSSSSLIYRVVTMTATEDNIWIRCNGGGHGSFMQYIGNDLQIEISSGETDYTPHQSQNITLTSPVPLTKWDKLIKRDGKWYWDYAGKEYEITGKEFWIVPGDIQNYLTGSSSNMYFVQDGKVRDNTNIKNGYANRLSWRKSIWSVADGSEGFNYNSNQVHIRIRNSILGVSDDATNDEKTAAFVAYLQSQYDVGNPIKIWYELAEHELVPLLDEEQTLLNNLETYYGVTNIYNDQGCPMWLTYVADTKLYIDNKILSIQTAMI